jgi:phospholipid transport system substrate-binding protein
MNRSPTQSSSRTRRGLAGLLVASSLIAAAPAVFAQSAAPAAQAAKAGSPSALVLDNSTRILSTLETRRRCESFAKARTSMCGLFK